MKKRSTIFNIVSYIVLVAYALLMFYYAIIPLNIPLDIPFDSKRLLYHFLEHIIFGFLLFNATRNYKRTLVLGLFYSSLIEVIQLWVPTRVFDLYDLSANLLGLLIGLFIFSKVRESTSLNTSRLYEPLWIKKRHFRR